MLYMIDSTMLVQKDEKSLTLLPMRVEEIRKDRMGMVKKKKGDCFHLLSFLFRKIMSVEFKVKSL